MTIYINPSIVLSAALSSLRRPVFLWQNMISGVTADHEDANYPASNLLTPQTFSLWKAGSTAVQNLVFTVDGAGLVNSVGVARHNWGSAHVGVKMYAMTSEPGAVWVLVADLSPGSDAPLLAVFDSDYYTQVKIELTPDAIAPQAAVVYAGQLLKMPILIPVGHTPLFDALDITTQSNVAENGDFIGDIITSEELSTSISFRQLDGDWFRTYMRPFLQSRDPFFYCRNPVLHPTESSYAKFRGSQKPAINQTTGQYDITLSLVGLAL